MNKVITNSTMCYLCDALERYIAHLNETNPTQGSREWLDGRKYSIGCSELYNGCGTPTMKRNLANSKMGKGPDMSHIISIIHGNVYESSTKKVTELVLGTKIFNVSGSIRHPNGIISCSPDGLGVVKLPVKVAMRLINKKSKDTLFYKNNRIKVDSKKLFEPAILVDDSIINNFDWQPPSDDGTDVKLIALYEFKSRCQKELQFNEIEPGHLYQVLGGIGVMKVAYNVGVYSESWFDIGAFTNDKVVITDVHRRQQNAIYFGSCKYVKLVDETPITMVDLNLYTLKGKKVTQDYIVIDGPYLFQCGDVITFDDNGFFELYPETACVPPPTCLDMLNVYYEQVNNILQNSRNKPSMFATYKLNKMSIKYVGGLTDFINHVEPYCKEVLDSISS
jgi:hypothetical protein